ncbi:amidohydrolase family protein [Mesoaciditoga lauensis]|uniref:amidohydrolase family protein n=1 Tax=Mesoaciditoga lauensis TaxID=1495039 RepID=UPI00056C167E|nr:amidohydrolase family protein [Mesoaciditoga lauensis]
MLIKNVRLVSNDSEIGIIEKAALYIEEGEIVEVGPSEALEKKYSNVNDVIDGNGMTVLPGFVNAYVKMESAIFPAFGIEERSGIPSEELYHKISEVLQNVLNEEIFFTIAEKIAHDSLKQGVTAIAGSIDRYLHKIEVEKTIESVVSTRPFHFAVGEGIKTPEDLQRLLKSGEHPKYIPLNSITSFDDSDLRELKQFADSTGAFIVILLSDELTEEKEAFFKYGMSNLERLRHISMLGDHEVIVNAQHFTETDLDIMASTDTMAVYCPREMMIKNMMFPDVDGMMGRGVNLSIGSGEVHDFSVLMESQIAFLLRRMLKGGSDFDSIYQTKKILLDNNYHFASKLLDKPIGKLIPGYSADFALYNYRGPLGRGKKPILRNLLFDFVRDARVQLTFVNGKIAYDARKDDGDEIEEKIQEIREKILSKV